MSFSAAPTGAWPEGPFMASKMQVWEGFWAGWKERYGVLKGNKLCITESEHSAVRCGEVEFVAGCTVDFGLEREGDSDENMHEGTALSFTVRGGGATAHTHIRVDSPAVRDRWVVALQMAASPTGDDSNQSVSMRLVRHLQTIRMAHQVLIGQMASLAELAEALAIYPEVPLLLAEGRIGTMMTGAVLSSATPAIQWVIDLEGAYKVATESEEESQRQLIGLAEQLSQNGYKELEDISTGLDQEVDELVAGSYSEDPTLAQGRDYRHMILQLELHKESISAQSGLITTRISSLAALERSLAANEDLNRASNPQPYMHSTGSRTGPPSGTPSIYSLQSMPVNPSLHPSHLSMLESASMYASLPPVNPQYQYPPPIHSTANFANSPLHQACNTGLLLGASMNTVQDSVSEMVRLVIGHSVVLSARYRSCRQRRLVIQQRLLARVTLLEPQGPSTDHQPMEKALQSTVDPQRLTSIQFSAFAMEVVDFFNLFFASGAPGLSDIYEQLNYFDLSITPWSSNQSGAQRTIKFSLDVDTPLGMKVANNIDEQTLTWMPVRRGFTVESRVVALNMPYGHTFCTKARYYVVSLGQGQCQVDLSGGIDWINKPYFASISDMIESRVHRSLGQFAERFMLYARHHQAPGPPSDISQETITQLESLPVASSAMPTNRRKVLKTIDQSPAARANWGLNGDDRIDSLIQ
eukprot:Ihof_evm2s364 gene=Ihof_evmTU2s364